VLPRNISFMRVVVPRCARLADADRRSGPPHPGRLASLSVSYYPPSHRLDGREYIFGASSTHGDAP